MKRAALCKGLGIAWALPIAIGLGFWGGCSTSDGVLSPAEVVEGGKGTLGQQIRVRGTVQAISFERERKGKGDFALKTGRYLLLSVPGKEDTFGLGVLLTPKLWLGRGLPVPGDEVEVLGTLSEVDWEIAKYKVVSPVAEWQVVKSTKGKLQAQGEACKLDMECEDHLLCSRAGRCEPLPLLTWGDDLRNVHGTCKADEDCPSGQTCDLRYKVKGEGEYRPINRGTKDVGRYLCQVDRALSAQGICPKPVTVSDLLSGRYPEGKELCVRATVAYAVFAPEDHDTHVQASIPAPDYFPETEPSLNPFGASLENVPPYKDPENPGVLVDPKAGERVDVLGTVHFDPGHGWWELHPIKWVEKAP